MSARPYSVPKIAGLLAGLVLIGAGAVVTFALHVPFTGGFNSSSVCPDGQWSDYDLSMLPPGYTCFYSDGRIVPMGVTAGRISVGLAAACALLIAVVVAVSLLGARSGHRGR